MKIAVFPSYGINYLPENILEKVKNSNKSFRLVVAEELEKLPYTDEMGNPVKIIDRFMKDKKREYVKIKDLDTIYFKINEGKYNETSRVRLVEVDTTKPWKIVEYDGAETIEYFEGIKVIDRETNQCEW